VSCKCDLLDRLTAEQFDISYRIVEPKTQVKLRKTRPVKEFAESEVARDARDALMFNAGRFTAGARDTVAVSSNETLQLLLEQND